MAALISTATRSALVSTLASERGRLNTAHAAHAAQEDLYGPEDAQVAKCWARVERIREGIQKLEDTLLALDPQAPEALQFMHGKRRGDAMRRLQALRDAALDAMMAEREADGAAAEAAMAVVDAAQAADTYSKRDRRIESLMRAEFGGYTRAEAEEIVESGEFPPAHTSTQVDPEVEARYVEEVLAAAPWPVLAPETTAQSAGLLDRNGIPTAKYWRVVDEIPF
jgi:hypothetical protein